VTVSAVTRPRSAVILSITPDASSACSGGPVTVVTMPRSEVAPPHRTVAPAVQVYKGFAEWLTTHPMPFVEVAGQDDAVLVHALSSPPHQVWAEAIIRGRGGSGAAASASGHHLTATRLLRW
jgi:hypothetical protein